MAFSEHSFDDIISACDESGKKYDIDALKKAYDFAEKAHEGQYRKSGERYFNHPVSVAIILIKLGMDIDTITAAFLHDVVEDTEYTENDIREIFGKDVAMLVQGVTKLKKIKNASREENQAENIRKMLLAMAEDIRVIIIKLADRLHNMRTLSAQSAQKQRDISKETLDVYAPLAHRLGIRAIKEELEDISIRFLDPVAYAEIEHSLDSKKKYRDEFINSIISRLDVRLKEHISSVTVSGRVKSIHGIYRKMYLQGKTIDEIYDIYAVRVITDTVADCYNILGFVHDMFRPLPGRFKDYISTPKPNMYQSLHTTLLSREGIPFEVQIRTWDMHRTAELGIAAHWKYKEGVKKSDDKLDERLQWVRKLLDNQEETDDAAEMVTSIRSDLTQDDVFAITPKGDVVSLPAGSCVIDFAYAIHTAVGNKTVGAKVDGRIVQLSHIIKTGEVIEILTTSQPHGPSRDWLKIVKTSEARNKIRSWFKKEKREENIEQGKAEIDREFRRNYINLTPEEYDNMMRELANRQHCDTVDDFYAAIGYGGIAVSRMMPRIKDDYKALRKKTEATLEQYIRKPTENKHRHDSVVVDEMDNCLVKLSKCCNPLPGDAIIGFITRGHGVSVHKRDCVNVPKNLSEDTSGRWISVRWTGDIQQSFQSTLKIHAIDRSGLLADVTVAIGNLRLYMHSASARALKDGNCEITVTISIENVEHLKNIINKLSKIQGVYLIERT